MASPDCRCCRRVSATSAVLHFWQSRPDGSRSATVEPYSLCSTCCDWLTAQIRSSRSPVRVEPLLLGSPAAAGRALVFDNQCQVCRNITEGTAAAITCVAANERWAWSLPLLCAACAFWIAGLADDARSARGAAARAVDGPYGRWPHSDFRNLTVEVDIRDAGALAVGRESFEAMGMKWWTRGSGPLAELLFFEVAATRGRGRLPAGQPRVALARLSNRNALIAALTSKTAAWLTIPVTPQQIAAAISRAVRQPGLRVRWDSETALPIADPGSITRAAIFVDPLPGVAPFEVAWLMRRFTRGYDDVALVGGRITVVPRAMAADVERVRARLAGQFSSICTVSLAAEASFPRFEAAG